MSSNKQHKNQNSVANRRRFVAFAGAGESDVAGLVAREGAHGAPLFQVEAQAVLWKRGQSLSSARARERARADSRKAVEMMVEKGGR